MKRPIDLSHDFLSEIVTKDSILVDGTMGKGNDTLYFAPLVKQLFAFDIQKEALEITRKKIEDKAYKNVQLILDGHENLDHYVDKVDAAIFNLGYLPSADKSIITKPHTTIEALEKVLARLSKGGRIAIMVYYGHQGGQKEKDALMDYLSQLDQKEVTVMTYKAINQVNTPPFLIMIEKHS
ncbi:tRNA (mnm(5)s(2)U34)-methyltransferase [Streptococcus catagoni]|uniref:tRNA (mnm(5)s(2)U34)-methyltransferase n=1 Tax=Streptococcus catagoni TaxID=2654874 RepID=UPI00140D34BF|nr:class I SAM-dependent methyltransferase [Streptococcus catagoni]